MDHVKIQTSKNHKIHLALNHAVHNALIRNRFVPSLSDINQCPPPSRHDNMFPDDVGKRHQQYDNEHLIGRDDEHRARRAKSDTRTGSYENALGLLLLSRQCP
ncbi:hypothetical protein CHU98_g12595 [Xylaria longipes]|nr:hypothetical protein CHU98_g12595 [Xylaria longipes]